MSKQVSSVLLHYKLLLLGPDSNSLHGAGCDLASGHAGCRDGLRCNSTSKDISRS